MNEFNLSDKVKVTATSLEGRIVGIWLSEGNQPQYNVRLHDSTGRPCDFWYFAGDIEKI
ncbi:MAG: hypothetical protein LLF76_08080 [Planctomycetaceae bacterium]|nr:hypothetical protein [Planctomycetaceae bacterium]